ncbi:MAG: hypothetical protein WHT65_06820 [Pseudothermotoga sp.]
MKKILFLLFLVVAVVGFSYQWEVFPGFFKPLENLAMGGVYTTTEGMSALVLNPALFTPGFELIFSPGLSNNVTELTKLFPYISNPASITDLATDTVLLASLQGVHNYDLNLVAGYGAQIGDFVVGGLGGLQASAFWNLSLMKLDNVELGAWMDYFGVVGGAMRFENIRVGAAFGGGMAGFIIPATGTTYSAQVNLLGSDPFADILPDDPSKILANINKPFFVASAGFAYDVENFRLGMSLFANFNDILSNGQRYILSLGASYTWQFLTVAAELEDLLNQEKTIFRKLNFGLKTDFGFVKLYGGLHAGWLTGGVKLDIPFVKIGFAAYVYEYSNYAGLMGEQRFVLSFESKF